ncbi:MAG: VWA domain-containing protein [Acidobacteriota bacterium]
MKRIISISLFLLICVYQVTSQLAFGQSTEQSIKLSTELVVLDAQIINKKTGVSIADLKKEEVTIYEDGVKQEITHFSQDLLPLSILIVIDTSGSVWDIIKEMGDETIEALNQLKESDEVAVMGTASRTELIQGFTTDRKLIGERIQAIDKKSLGRDGILLHEALYQAALLFKNASNPASRRVILVVSDNLSTQKLGQGHSEKEALNEIYESGSVVCGINVSSLNETILKLDPFFYAMKPFLFRGDIKKYAEKTGGIVSKTGKKEISEKLATLINQLRNRYAIGYVSTNTQKDGKYRKIKLQLSPDVEKREGQVGIVTRKGYYASKAKDISTLK